MDVIARIDQARRRCNVLEHPFYERWSAGQLSEQELAVYSQQYRHAVLALAEASRLAAAEVGAEHATGLERHAAEEAAHVALWDQFAARAGEAAPSVSAPAPSADMAPTAERPDGACGEVAAAHQAAFIETQQCARTWTAGEDALEHLAVLYAIEASQPEIAKIKLKGLVERYGYNAEGPATEYFRLHATLDVEHARQAAGLIERLMSDDAAEREAQAERMLAAAQAALEGNWALLDGVDAYFSRD